MMNLPEEHEEPDYEKAELDLLWDALKKRMKSDSLLDEAYETGN